MPAVVLGHRAALEKIAREIGLKIELAAALRRQPVADVAGKVEFVTNPSASACGLALQVVDLTTCAASNVVLL